VTSNPAHGEVYSIQHYVIKFVSVLRHVGTPVSSTNETDHHDITEILLKVALNTINLNQSYYVTISKAVKRRLTTFLWVHPVLWTLKNIWILCQWPKENNSILATSTAKRKSTRWMLDLNNHILDLSPIFEWINELLNVYPWPLKSFWNRGPSWPWSYGSWIYNYLCNQCQSPLMLWVLISIRARCATLCDKVCQWLATGRWFCQGLPIKLTVTI
jgi:hypothetical protein